MWPGERGLHLILVRIGILVEQPFRGHHPSGGAEAAIGGHARMADALQRMQVLLVAHAFNGENLLAHGFGRQGVAGIERHAVHQNAASAATGAIAAPVGARQAQLHRNHFPQRGAGFVFGGISLAVDDERSFFVRERRWQRREEPWEPRPAFPRSRP